MNAAIEFLDAYWLAVASHLGQSTIVVLAVLALSRGMRRAPARVLNAMWWVALLRFVVPFSLLAPAVRRVLAGLLVRAGEAGPVLAGTGAVLERAIPMLDPVRAVVEPGTASLGAAGLALAAVWVAGGLWLGLSWARSASSGAPARMISPDQLPAELRCRLDRVLIDTGIDRRVVLLTGERVMPYVTGSLRRRIVVPRSLLWNLGPQELKAVLLHEDAHRRRFEPLQAAVQRLAAVMFYFFPPFWAVLARLRETSELACDEHVIRRGVPAAVYARALARTVSMNLVPVPAAPGLARGASTLTRRRLERLRNEGGFTMRKVYWVPLGLAVLAAVATAVSSAVPLAFADETTLNVEAEVTTDEEGEKIVEVTIEGDEDDAQEERTYTLTLVDSTDPVYPKDARKDGAGGRVMLQLTIDPDGVVTEVVPVEEVEEYPSFTEAATEAASQWTFEVGGDIDDDQVIEVIVPVEFKIDGQKTMELKVTVPDVEKPSETQEEEQSEE